MVFSRLHAAFLLAVILSGAAVYHLQQNTWNALRPNPQPKKKVTYRKVTMTQNIAIKRREKDIANLKTVTEGGQTSSGTHHLWYRTNVSESNNTDNMLPSTGLCQPHLNVAFLKVHKCGSSTVADLINRFCYKRKLIAALAPTRARSILGSFGTINESDYKHPPGGKRWNIFTLHAMYNRTRFHQLMDPNTRYVTILREPLRRLQSAFRYFHLETRFPGLKRQTPRGVSYVTTYLKRPKFWDMRFRPPQSKEDREHLCFRNCIARDLGLKENDYDNFNAVQDFIQGIDNDFTTVMILEYLPESLVLLKRRMCWTFHDILYSTSKKQQYGLKANITGRMKDMFYKHNRADVMLYTHFKDSFQRQIKKEGADFLQEVQHFKRVNENVSVFCRSIKPHTSRNMTVQKSKWSEAFSVNSFLCKSYDKPNVRKYWYPLLQSLYH